MIYVFTETEQPLTAAELHEFEEEQNIVLPENYKKLMLLYNGGYFEGHKYFDTLKSIKYGDVTVEQTIYIHQNLENNIPEGYFPFANDCCNNPLTMCLLTGRDYGKVFLFYFDSDRKPEVIAKSLESLFGVKDFERMELDLGGEND